MGLSKSTRILILLGIDSAFFLLELIVGQYDGVPFGQALLLTYSRLWSPFPCTCCGLVSYGM